MLLANMLSRAPTLSQAKRRLYTLKWPSLWNGNYSGQNCPTESTFTFRVVQSTDTSILESAWGANGRFFGRIYPDTAVDGGYHMDVLPLDGNLISFAGVGCREPIGVALVADKSESTAFVMDDGEVTKRTGQYPKVDLASVEKLLG